MTANQEQPNGQIGRVLGVFAHPDDPEFFAGATFAKWAQDGAEITFVIATSGDKGSADPEMTHERLAEIREREEREAAAALGVKDVVFLRYKDGELFPTLELRRDITRMIRMKKPDVVVTLDPTVFWRRNGGINHPRPSRDRRGHPGSGFPNGARSLEFHRARTRRGLGNAQGADHLHRRRR